jgi:hypothetical protein
MRSGVAACREPQATCAVQSARTRGESCGGCIARSPVPLLSAPISLLASAVAHIALSSHISLSLSSLLGSCRYAWGADELKPVSNRSHEWLRLGATLVDCLDNLWIMGMKAEFQEAREWVATRLHFTTARSISMFETVIRILGGLLSAYELSRDQIFLDKSVELADKMMYAFEKTRTGLPCTTISLTSTSCTFASWTGQSAILAEFGTIQLEFKYLAHHTGKQKYWDVAQRIMDHMRKVDKPHGLFPVFMSPSSGSWSSQKITLGALGDSFYEYLIKQWLITNKKEVHANPPPTIERHAARRPSDALAATPLTPPPPPPLPPPPPPPPPPLTLTPTLTPTLRCAFSAADVPARDVRLGHARHRAATRAALAPGWARLHRRLVGLGAHV